MKPLQNLLAKIGGQSAIKRLRAFAEEAAAEHRQAVTTLAHLGEDEIRAKRATLTEAWKKNPSAEAADALVEFEARAAVAVKVSAELHSQSSLAQDEKLSSYGGLFESALSESLGGFDEQHALIAQQDAERSEELGVPCESTNALRQILRSKEMLEQNVTMWRQNLPSAIRALLGAVKPPPAPRPQYRDVLSHPAEADAGRAYPINGA